MTATSDASGVVTFETNGLAWPLAVQVTGGTVVCPAAATGCVAGSNAKTYYGAFIGTRWMQHFQRGDNNVTDVDRISEVAITALTGQAPAQVFERPSLLAAVDDAALAAAAARMTGWASRLGTRTIGDDLTVSLLGGHLNGLVSRISTGFLVPLHLSWTDLGLLYAADPNSTARPPVGLFCDVAGAYAGTLVGQVPDGTWTGSIDRFGVFSGTFVDSSGASSGSGTSQLSRVGLGDIRAAGVFEFGKVEGIAQVSSTAVLVNGFSQALLTTITGRRTSSDPACT